MKYNNSFAPESCTTLKAPFSQNICVLVYSSVKQHKRLFIWPELNHRILKFDKMNRSCCFALCKNDDLKLRFFGRRRRLPLVLVKTGTHFRNI